MITYRTKLGIEGEQAVASYLKAQNFTILATNFRIHGGEVDIIAQNRELTLFVEVKTRSNPLVDPAEVITRSKQKKIIFATQVFLGQRRLLNDTRTIRFDVALVSFTASKPQIAYIPNAFQADEYV